MGRTILNTGWKSERADRRVVAWSLGRVLFGRTSYLSVAIQLDASAVLHHPVRQGARHADLAGEATGCLAEGGVLEHVVFFLGYFVRTPAGCLVRHATCLRIVSLCVTHVGMTGSTFELAATCSLYTGQVVASRHLHEGLAFLALHVVPLSIVRVETERQQVGGISGAGTGPSLRRDVRSMDDRRAPRVDVIALLGLGHAQPTAPPRPQHEPFSQVVQVMSRRWRRERSAHKQRRVRHTQVAVPVAMRIHESTRSKLVAAHMTDGPHADPAGWLRAFEAALRLVLLDRLLQGVIQSRTCYAAAAVAHSVRTHIDVRFVLVLRFVPQGLQGRA